MKWLERFADPAYVLVRILSGAMFAFHGVQHLFGVLSPARAAVGSQVWIGGIIELLGGLAVALGLRTRVAALLCSGTMAVAYCQFHWKFRWGTAFLPGVNRGELALLYCVVFLFIACRGGRDWSLD